MPTALHKMLPAGRPGERFRNRYHQHQKSKSRGPGRMILRFVLAGLSAAVGVVLVFIPGPAVVFFLISGALLAADWLPVARLLDWGEVRARRIWGRVRPFWTKRSLPARVAIVATAVVLGAAASVGFFLLIR